MAGLAKHRDLLSATDVKLKKLEKDLAHSRDEARTQLAEAQQEAAVKLESLKVGKYNCNVHCYSLQFIHSCRFRCGLCVLWPSGGRGCQ